MRITDIVTLVPGAETLLAEYGLHCAGCSANGLESLHEGWMSHGRKEEELGALVTDLNILLAKAPARPKTIDVTEAAAKALAALLEAEGQADHILVVGVDDAGGFSMDVLPDVANDHVFFGHETVPTLRVAASPLTLSRIGGATIDHRENRFKLDLPEDMQKKGCACKSGPASHGSAEARGSCGCA